MALEESATDLPTSPSPQEAAIAKMISAMEQRILMNMNALIKLLSDQFADFMISLEIVNRKADKAIETGTALQEQMEAIVKENGYLNDCVQLWSPSPDRTT